MARRRGKKTAFAAREFIGGSDTDYGLGGSLGGTADDGGSSWDTGGSQLDGGSGGWGFDGGGYAGDGTDNGYGDTGSGWGGLGMGGGGYDNGDGNYNSGIGYGGYGSDLSGGMALGGFSPTDGQVSIQEAMARYYANPANQPQAPAAPQGMFGPRAGVGTGYLSAQSGLTSPMKASALSQMFSSQPEQKMQDQVPQDQFGIITDPAYASGAAAFQDIVMGAPGMRIAGGTDEILRNIIAERVLGMPGDIRVDKDLPFKDLPTGR